MFENLRTELSRAVHRLDAEPQGTPHNLGQLRALFPAQHTFMPAAVLVPICLRPHGPTVVLTRRNEELKHHAGQISFPGGRVETSDAGALGAAAREACEEIAMQAQWLEPLGYLDPLLTITGFRVVPVVALIDGEAQFAAEPGEVAEVFEVPFEFFCNPDNQAEREFFFHGQPRRVLSYPYRAYDTDYDIWGATAMILHNLVDRLHRTRTP